VNIIFDQGNTFLKVALIEAGELVLVDRWKEFSAEQFQNLIEPYDVRKAIWSSVATDIPSQLQNSEIDTLVFDHQQVLPFELNYDTPETLGLDRIALAAAAYYKYPAQDCLIIDAGTALTYDFIDRAGVYHGGAISPGLEMRYKALHHFTNRLPLVTPVKKAELIGKSTAGSIQSGVQNGILQEVKATIEAYRDRYPQLITLITGGDASAFDSLLKNSIFAAPDFVLLGLNYILEHHAEKN